LIDNTLIGGVDFKTPRSVVTGNIPLHIFQLDAYNSFDSYRIRKEAMAQDQSTFNLGKNITSEELIRSALDDQVKSIIGYEEIIWKIRSGYVVILYGALTLLLGKEGIGKVVAPNDDYRYLLCILALIFGLSFSVFWIDFGYVRKKLKIVAARDKLVELAFKGKISGDDKMVDRLLRIAGETPPKLLAKDVRADYEEKRNWNLRWILSAIYAATPILAIIVFVIYFFLNRWP